MVDPTGPVSETPPAVVAVVPDLPTAGAVVADQVAASVHEEATAVANEATAEARQAVSAAVAARADEAQAATAHAATSAVVAVMHPPPTTIANLLLRVAGWLDIETWPESSVASIIVVGVIVTAIAGFWRGEKWELPDVLGTLLPMVWGFLMALPTTSSLKAWMVIGMLFNVLLMTLWFPTGWTPPVLRTLATAGAAQYVVGKALRKEPDLNGGG